MPQQQLEEKMTWGQKFNLAWAFANVHDRALMVPFREGWGVDAIGFPSLFAFFLILLWALFSQDILMLFWLALWVPSQLYRRWQAGRLARKGQMHSWSTGYCKGLVKFFGVRLAKKNEPLYMGAIGGLVYWFYDQLGWPQGISYFFGLGMFTIPFCEWVNATIWERRTRAMVNSRLDNQAMVRAYRERTGE